MGVRGGDNYCSGAGEDVRSRGEDTGASDGRWQEKREGVLGGSSSKVPMIHNVVISMHIAEKWGNAPEIRVRQCNSVLIT